MSHYIYVAVGTVGFVCDCMYNVYTIMCIYSELSQDYVVMPPSTLLTFTQS